MVHVSSAYVNAYMLDAEEKLYPPLEEDQAQKLIDLVNTLSDDAIEEVTPKYVVIYFLKKH
jgi:alcohol-forming fatty acyl-CoA reductase